MNKSSMYILIKDSVSTGHAVLAAAHASLSGYLTFIDHDMALIEAYKQDLNNLTLATSFLRHCLLPAEAAHILLR